ncbi:Nucleolar protein 6 [Porphyridium purpureum]|uniref:Nucleolar protein 6 n=1 Tax=Porphyridium purpureum TaxID=35688 RepID=A0A5J4YNQ6_PORPP|nr:Nucleolar protein 6 [Porphyridium purpureum]|eukprot:POR4030..scf222_8
MKKRESQVSDALQRAARGLLCACMSHGAEQHEMCVEQVRAACMSFSVSENARDMTTAPVAPARKGKKRTAAGENSAAAQVDELAVHEVVKMFPAMDLLSNTYQKRVESNDESPPARLKCAPPQSVIVVGAHAHDLVHARARAPPRSGVGSEPNSTDHPCSDDRQGCVVDLCATAPAGLFEAADIEPSRFRDKRALYAALLYRHLHDVLVKGRGWQMADASCSTPLSSTNIAEVLSADEPFSPCSILLAPPRKTTEGKGSNRMITVRLFVAASESSFSHVAAVSRTKLQARRSELLDEMHGSASSLFAKNTHEELRARMRKLDGLEMVLYDLQLTTQRSAAFARHAFAKHVHAPLVVRLLKHYFCRTAGMANVGPCEPTRHGTKVSPVPAGSAPTMLSSAYSGFLITAIAMRAMETLSGQLPFIQLLRGVLNRIALGMNVHVSRSGPGAVPLAGDDDGLERTVPSVDFDLDICGLTPGRWTLLQHLARRVLRELDHWQNQATDVGRGVDSRSNPVMQSFVHEDLLLFDGSIHITATGPSTCSSLLLECVARFALRQRALYVCMCSVSRSKDSSSEKTYAIGFKLRGDKPDSQLFQRVDRVADASGSAELKRAFVQFWGQASVSRRRFQDGQIDLAVVWEPDDQLVRKHGMRVALLHVILLRAVSLYGVSIQRPAQLAVTLDFQCSRIASAFSGDYDSAQHEQQRLRLRARVAECVDTLSKVLCALPADKFPLHIVTVRYAQGSALVRGTSAATSQYLAGASVRHGQPVQSVDLVLTAESSTAWPDDVEALRAVKAAMYVSLASQLTAHSKLDAMGWEAAHASRDCVWITLRPRITFAKGQDDAVVFRVLLHITAETVLLRRECEKERRNPAEVNGSAELALAQHLWVHERLPALHGILHDVQMRFGPFADTARIAKQWVASHMLSNHMGDELVELLVAAPLLCAPNAALAPRSTCSLLFAFFNLVATHDWTEPLDMRTDTARTLEHTRQAPERGFSVLLDIDNSIDGSGGGTSGWTFGSLSRPKASATGSTGITSLAQRSALKRSVFLARLAVSNCAPLLSEAGFLKRRANGLFVPDLGVFDSVVMCKSFEWNIEAADQLPGSMRAVLFQMMPAQTKHKGKDSVKRRRLDLSQGSRMGAEGHALFSPLGMEMLCFNPKVEFVEMLETRFGRFAIFFANFLESSTSSIGVVWKPTVRSPRAFDLHNLEYAKPVQIQPQRSGQAAGTFSVSEPPLLQTDTDLILEEIAALGGPSLIEGFRPFKP